MIQDAQLTALVNRIDLWLSFPEQITDPRLLERYRALLSVGEKQRGDAFHFERDRHRHLVTRALVRTVLSRYVPIPPEEWIFETNSYGRPHIVSSDPLVARLSFNVSHTAGLIALAVGFDRAIGIDAENVTHGTAGIEIAERFFSSIECAALASLPSELQHDRFFDYWTLKESYIKARGMGLSIPLDRFSFQFSSDGAIGFAADPQVEANAERWRFWQFRFGDEHLIGLCVQCAASNVLRIEGRRTTPLSEDQELLMRPRRRSAS